jgi:hypothetical protein
MMKNAYIHCLDLISVWRRRRRRRPACVVERQRRRRRRSACARGRVAVAAEETVSSGVDEGGGDRGSRERWGLREFCDEKQNATGQATI